MQRLLLTCFLAVAFAACQKEIQPPCKNEYPDLVKSLLENLSVTDYNALDFSRISRSEYGELTLLRLAFNGKGIDESFVLVEVDKKGIINRGRIVTLTRVIQKEDYNGGLLIKDLNGEIIEEARIINGYRRSSDVLLRSQPFTTPNPYKELPEVVIVATYPPAGGNPSWETYMNLQSFFNNSGVGSGGWYSSGNPFGGSGGGGGGGMQDTPASPSTPSVPVDDEIIKIDFETQFADPAIDLDKFLKCFDNIPDAGATCKVTIYADVPVDSDPTKIMDWSTGSPGHTWVRIEKIGAGNTKVASQHIGFYPKKGWKTALTDAPVDGKFVNNSNHEFNASFEVTVSVQNLRLVINRIKQLKNVRYDIDDYNCTDWAMSVWRESVSPTSWFEIPRFHMPGSLSPKGTSTPQGLYVKIKEMVASGVAGATIPIIGWSGQSTGPCN